MRQQFRRQRGWLIFGNYGTSNTGDDAMLAGLVYGLRKRQQQVPIAVVSKGAQLSSRLRSLGAQPVEARVRPMWQAIRNAQGIILGGGTHFHDDYVMSRYVRHLRYMLRVLLLVALGHLLRKRIFLLGMGFGPFRSQLTEWISWMACSLAEHVTVRDLTSYQRATKWIGSSKLTQAFDLSALLYDNIARIESRKSHRNGSDELHLGVSVISIANIPGYGTQEDLAFQTAMERGIRQALNDKPNLKIPIFVFRGIWPRESDVEVSTRLWTALARDAPSRVALVPYDDPEQTLLRIADCDLFIATRFHAAVFAYLAWCPFLCLTYHSKCIDLAQTIDLPTPACLSPDDVLQGALPDRLLDLLQKPEAFQARLPVAEALSLTKQNLEVLPHLSD